MDTVYFRFHVTSPRAHTHAKDHPQRPPASDLVLLPDDHDSSGPQTTLLAVPRLYPVEIGENSLY